MVSGTDGIKSAAAGMIAQQLNIDVIANNLANVNTAGFKELIAVFKNVGDVELQDKSNNNGVNSSARIGSFSAGSSVDQTILDFQKGALKKTDNKLDFAIDGEGFFVVGSGTEQLYTRNGSFSVNQNGYLVTQDGKPVLSENNRPISIDLTDKSAENITVSNDGRISLGNEVVDKLKIVNFDNPAGLVQAGNSLYKPANSNVRPVERGNNVIQQGYVESSNSNVIGSMISTIAATRTYETLAKIIKTSENTLQRAVTDVGRVRE